MCAYFAGRVKYQSRNLQFTEASGRNTCLLFKIILLKKTHIPNKIPETVSNISTLISDSNFITWIVQLKILSYEIMETYKTCIVCIICSNMYYKSLWLQRWQFGGRIRNKCCWDMDSKKCWICLSLWSCCDYKYFFITISRHLISFNKYFCP